MGNPGVAKLLPAGTRIVRSFTAPEFGSGGTDIPSWDDAGMRLCKSRGKGRAVCGNGVFLKEYVYKSLWDRFRQRFKTPRPFVSLDAALRLEELKIPTPRVLAAVRGVSPCGWVRDVLATEELPPEVRFGDAAAAEPSGDRTSFADELVPVALRMHDGGMCHGDLSLRNWYRAPEGAWGLIDLDGATVSNGGASELRRTDELARLASSCFVYSTRPEDTVADLRAFVRVFAEKYAALGGRIRLDRMERRSVFLADRFRIKYLGMDVLK